jgi:hypothetical protein
MRRLLLLIVLGALCACVQKGQPVGAIEAYADAVESGNYARAYALMSQDFRARVSRDAFMRMMRESPADVRAAARRLRSGAQAVDIRATYVYDDTGEELRLVQEDGQWRLDMNPLDFYPQDTPRGALRSFIRAVEFKRYDVLVRLVPSEFAMTAEQIKAQFEGDMAKEVMGLVGRLREALEAPVVEVGDNRATILYGDRQTVTLVREDGAWKIEDFD